MKPVEPQTNILFLNGMTLSVMQTVAQITKEMKNREGFATVTFECSQTPSGLAEYTFHQDDVQEYDGLCNIED